MKRLMLVLMLLVVPTQAALAAICGYCEHHVEQAASAVPEHRGAAAESLDAAGHDATASDGGAHECALCHLGGAALVAATCMAAAVQVPTTPPAHRPPLYDPSHLQRIERVPLTPADSF